MASLALRRVSISGSKRQAGASYKEFSTRMLALTEEFPGLPATFPDKAKASAPEVTTLPFGLTLVTENAASSTTASLHFPKAGSAYEHLDEQGAAFLNKILNFKSASGLSSIAILRILENYGCQIFNNSGRRGTTVGYTAAPDKALPLIALLGGECSFEPWDVRDARAQAEIEAEYAAQTPEIVLTEHVNAAAYGPQSPMGRPYYSTHVSLDAIKSFRRRAYKAQGAILAVTGLSDHEDLVKVLIEDYEGEVDATDDKMSEPVYVGGESRLAVPHSDFAHLALAFSSGASAPVRNVVKHYFNLAGSGYSAFETQGLIGVYGGAPGSEAPALLDSISSAITSKPSADLVKRARILAKAEALFALESDSKTLAASLISAVKETGSCPSASSVAQAYDAITEKDVTSEIEKLLKSSPSLAAVGDIGLVPYHANIAPRFK